MYVYADVIIGLNCVLNIFILTLTAWAAGIHFKWWRIIAAALGASVYALGGILTELSLLYSIPVKFFISLIIVGVGLGFRSTRLFILHVGLFYVTSFILGGAVVGWLSYFQAGDYLASGLVLWKNISWVDILLGSFIGAVMLLLLIRGIISRQFRNRVSYLLKVEYEGMDVELTAMLDTGNRLFSLAGHRPVVIIEYKSLLPLFSDSIRQYLNNVTPSEWLANINSLQDGGWQGKIEVIPYQSVGSKSMLLGFRPDGLKVSSRTDSIYIKDVVIALSANKLSSDGSYSALLHPAIMHNFITSEEANICA